MCNRTKGYLQFLQTFPRTVCFPVLACKKESRHSGGCKHINVDAKCGRAQSCCDPLDRAGKSVVAPHTCSAFLFSVCFYYLFILWWLVDFGDPVVPLMPQNTVSPNCLLCTDSLFPSLCQGDNKGDQNGAALLLQCQLRKTWVYAPLLSGSSCSVRAFFTLQEKPKPTWKNKTQWLWLSQWTERTGHAWAASMHHSKRSCSPAMMTRSSHWSHRINL